MRQDSAKPLAVRAPLRETEAVMREARRREVYDDSRSVVRDGDCTEVPVEDRVPLMGYEVVVQDDPVLRRRSLDGFLEFVAPNYHVVGDVALVGFDGHSRDQKQDVAEALLELHPHIDTVVEDRGVEGVTREPDVEVIMGGETETLHRENGYRFKLDVGEVMFSVGNAGERKRMQEVVEEGERVYDMFAGIGYFSVPLALGGADVAAAEINPAAYEYLVENAGLNGVTESIDAVNRDCRDVVVDGDRAVLGHFDATSYVCHAVRCVGSGWLHVHDAAYDPMETVREVEAGVAEAGGVVESVDVRRVKGYSEGVDHVVVDARIV